MTKEQVRAQLAATFSQASKTELEELVERIFSAEHSNSVKGVEIFAPGKHNGDDYTEQDVDDMIAAFKDLDFRPALKVGHTKDYAGAPAYGWVTQLRKVGGKLVADFESMHDSVIAALRDKRYDRVSSEIYFNLKRGGKLFRRALKAVALLGAEPPAVAGLVPLHKMEFAAEGFEKLSSGEQALEVQQQSIIDALTARVASLSTQLAEQAATKKEDDMTLKELRAKKEALEAQVRELQAKDQAKLTDAEKASLATLTREIKEFGDKVEAEITRLSNTETENTALREQVAALAAKDRQREVDERVARCTIPAFRPSLAALYTHAVGNPTVRVKVFSTNKDNQRVETERSLAEAMDDLVTAVNAGAKTLFSVESQQRREDRPEGPRDGVDAGKEVDRLAKLRVADGKSKDYDEAVLVVLQSDPDLAERYNSGRLAA